MRLMVVEGDPNLAEFVACALRAEAPVWISPPMARRVNGTCSTTCSK